MSSARFMRSLPWGLHFWFRCLRLEEPISRHGSYARDQQRSNHHGNDRVHVEPQDEVERGHQRAQGTPSVETNTARQQPVRWLSWILRPA